MDIFGDDDDDDNVIHNDNNNSNNSSILDSVYNHIFTICMRIKATCYRNSSSDKHRITLSKKVAIIISSSSSSPSFIKRLKDARFSNVDVYSIDNILTTTTTTTTTTDADDDDDDDSLGKVYDVVIVLGLVSTNDVRDVGIALDSMLMNGGHLICTVASDTINTTTTPTTDNTSSSSAYDTIFDAHEWVLEGMLVNQNVYLTKG